MQTGVEVPAYPAPPAGPVTLTGRLRADETDPQQRAAFDLRGHQQLYAADPGVLAAATGLALEPGRLQLAADQPGVLVAVPVAPNTGAAPFTNFSYALQWLTFGAIALFALVYFVRLEMLQRRAGAGRAAERSAVRRALAGDDPDVPRPCRPDRHRRREPPGRAGGQHGRRRPHQPGQPGRPAQVVRRRGPARAQPRPLLHPVRVTVRAAEPHAERPGRRRLDRARVGARVRGRRHGATARRAAAG